MNLEVSVVNPSIANAAVGDDATTSQIKHVLKSYMGSRTYLAWKYDICIDGDPRKLLCKFCQKPLTERGLPLEAPLG